MPLLSIIIVNFNGANYIEACLNSVFESDVNFKFEVILVDNNSQDNSLEILEKFKDKISLIINEKNMGFSYANNQAAKVSKGELLFLLNNDTKIETQTIQKLIDYQKENPDLGAIMPRLLNADGSIQCPGSSLNHWRYKSSKPTKVPFLSGAAIVMTKKLYTEVGGLDENYFFYTDDIDLSKTLIRKGYVLMYYPLAQLIHYGGLSTKTRKVGSLIEGYRGGIYFSQKHYIKPISILYRFVLMFDILLNLIINGLLFFRKESKDLFFGYLEILRINITNDVILKR